LQLIEHKVLLLPMKLKLLIFLLCPALIAVIAQPSKQAHLDPDSESEGACDATENASCFGSTPTIADGGPDSHFGVKRATLLKVSPLVTCWLR